MLAEGIHKRYNICASGIGWLGLCGLADHLSLKTLLCNGLLCIEVLLVMPCSFTQFLNNKMMVNFQRGPFIFIGNMNVGTRSSLQ